MNVLNYMYMDMQWKNIDEQSYLSMQKYGSGNMVHVQTVSTRLFPPPTKMSWVYMGVAFCTGKTLRQYGGIWIPASNA